MGKALAQEGRKEGNEIILLRVASRFAVSKMANYSNKLAVQTVSRMVGWFSSNNSAIDQSSRPRIVNKMRNITYFNPHPRGWLAWLLAVTEKWGGAHYAPGFPICGVILYVVTLRITLKFSPQSKRHYKIEIFYPFLRHTLVPMCGDSYFPSLIFASHFERFYRNLIDTIIGHPSVIYYFYVRRTIAS